MPMSQEGLAGLKRLTGKPYSCQFIEANSRACAFKRPFPIDRVRAVEEFDLGAIAQAQLHVMAARFRVFVSDPFVRRDAQRRLECDWGSARIPRGSMKKSRAKTGDSVSIPKPLRVFAWNLNGRLTAAGKKQIALNVIERGRAWHWTKLPKGWFDLEFCLEHGQMKTKQTLRELFRERR